MRNVLLYIFFLLISMKCLIAIVIGTLILAVEFFLHDIPTYTFYGFSINCMAIGTKGLKLM